MSRVEELIARSQAGDMEARELLVQENSVQSVTMRISAPLKLITISLEPMNLWIFVNW